MPQGRKKVPFSGKAKKMQLQAKRQHKAASYAPGPVRGDDDSDDEPNSLKVNVQPSGRSSRSNPNRFALQFHRESDADIKLRREDAQRALVPVSEEELEVDPDTYFLPGLEFPKRPPWNYDMSAEELDLREQRYFREYISEIEKKFNWKELSYFELNLETWRQLWRVLEMSDVILLIVDIRFPALMFPPSLYNHVTETLKKHMILVLNKVDLVPPPLVAAWVTYFKEHYPELHVLMFTSFPEYNLREKHGFYGSRRKRGRMRMAAECAQGILDVCKEIVKDEVDLSPWQTKITEEMKQEYDDYELEVGEHINLQSTDTKFFEHVRFLEGTLTIGCVGQPNVGKSSLMNAVMGKKVVSVSSTPGHTKHFQTIFLTKNVRLCDCPGLVFPSKVPRVIQVLMGSFPIAQLREPYSAIRFIAERLDLVKALRLRHPENEEEWSPMDICESWALKRKFFTAKAARPDTYRAANHLLRVALEGRILVCLRPKGYLQKKEFWESHPLIQHVYRIRATNSISTRLTTGLSSSEDERGDVDPKRAPTYEESDSETNKESDDDDDAGYSAGDDHISDNKFALLGGID